MKHRILTIFLILITNITQAQAILEIVPASSSPIVIGQSSYTYLNFSVRNNTSQPIQGLTIYPNYGQGAKPVKFSIVDNQCTGISLAAGSSCGFSLVIQSLNQNANFTLTPRVCAYRNAVCSVPLSANRVSVNVTANLPNQTFPIPYAGTFYPIYNSGAGQWLPPNQPPFPPFDKVSAVFVAFAHAYPQGLGAIFTYEAGQPNEPARLALLTRTIRQENPDTKILISLGWGKQDWTYINRDYVNHANIFVPSVIQFIRANHLDGMDIDDEGIGDTGPGGSGEISQTNFNGVIANLRNALNDASLRDGKPYYLTITPAGNNQDGGIENTQVDKLNAYSFNLINIQTYYNGSDTFGEDFYNALIAIGYPSTQIANGIDTQESCNPEIPEYQGLAGLFNWNMTADSVCSDYQNTRLIANLVGYP